MSAIVSPCCTNGLRMPILQRPVEMQQKASQTKLDMTTLDREEIPRMKTIPALARLQLITMHNIMAVTVVVKQEAKLVLISNNGIRMRTINGINNIMAMDNNINKISSNNRMRDNITNRVKVPQQNNKIVCVYTDTLFGLYCFSKMSMINELGEKRDMKRIFYMSSSVGRIL